MREWLVQDQVYRDAVDFLLRDTQDGRRSIARAEFTFEPHESNTLVEPTMSLTRPEAQQLMNGLWQAGLRPRDGNGSQAHTDGLQAHLSDLRKIAFHALKIK